jgi:hypothetical protein
MEGFTVSLGSILSSIGQSVASFAPTIASMLGGPLAGTAVTALEGALGIGSDPKADLATRAGNIAQMLQNAQLTGDQIVAIKAAELHHAELIGQQGIDLAKINADHDAAGWNADVEDRKSARDRQVQMKDQTPAILAYAIIGGAFAISIAQLFVLVGYGDAVNKIPPQGWLLIGNMSGYLWAEAKAATSFFFGSSAGSAKKDDTIKAQAEAAQ